jgi:hypothetical protein
MTERATVLYIGGLGRSGIRPTAASVWRSGLPLTKGGAQRLESAQA